MAAPWLASMVGSSSDGHVFLECLPSHAPTPAPSPPHVGPKMQDRLRKGPGDVCKVHSFDAKDYTDTKIKLHFSHFKILVSF